MFLILFFATLVLGLLIGSFLNVVIYRYQTKLSPLSGCSQCLTCGKGLAWYELVPVVSYICQRGVCRGCKSPISMQYLMVELCTAALFCLVFLRQYVLYISVYSFYTNGMVYSALFVAYYWIIACLLVIIAVYDMRHKIIPDAFVYSLIGLSVVKLATFLFWCLPTVTGNPVLQTAFSFPYVYDLLAPLLFFLPFWFLWYVSNGRWIGYGDAKLALAIGALLGFVSGLSAIVLGFWIGAVVCVLLLVLQKLFPRKTEALFGRLGMSSEVAFGPFLILGIVIVLFSQVDVLGIAPFFNV